MPAKLSVNLNAIAMLRNRRDLPWPSVIGLGRVALAAGAYGLTVHPRPDERHTRHSDLPQIRALIDDEFPNAEFNIEGYPTEDFLRLVEKNEPDQVTLVPDDPTQATSDHGWDFQTQSTFLTPIVRRLKKGGFRVSLFSDPDPHGVQAAADTGADRIELYTGPYGSFHNEFSKGGQRTGNAWKNCGCCFFGGACGQCRPRSHGRQSAGAGKADSGPCRGVDRPWLDSRRAGIWDGGDGPAVAQGVRVVSAPSAVLNDECKESPLLLRCNRTIAARQSWME